MNRDTKHPAAILQAVKNAIRQPYAWPGGYPLYILMADGEPLSIKAARAHWDLICRETITNMGGTWAASGVQINWETPDLVCAHTGNALEYAY